MPALATTSRSSRLNMILLDMVASLFVRGVDFQV